MLAATNADLEQRVAEGKFREDLYYRLSVIRIHVPSLRERREEIPHLSTFFLRDACERLGKRDVQMSSDDARPLRPLLVARQRPAAAERSAAGRGHGAARRDRSSPNICRQTLTAPSAAGRRFDSWRDVAPRLEPGNLAEAVEQVERQLITTTLATSRRQHLRDRASARPDTPRTVSEDASTRPGRRSGRNLTRPRRVRRRILVYKQIPSSQVYRPVYTQVSKPTDPRKHRLYLLPVTSQDFSGSSSFRDRLRKGGPAH